MKGFSFSLERGNGDHADKIYFGARYLNTQLRLDLAFIRFSTFGDGEAAHLSRLAYLIDDCSDASGASGHSDEDIAPVINYMAFSDNQLFGLASSHHEDSNDDLMAFEEALVWRVNIDSKGDALAGTLKVKKIESSMFKHEFIGMRRIMEEDNGNYYIHAVYN